MNKLVILALCGFFGAAVLISSCSKPLDQPGYTGFRCDLNNTEYIADTAYYTKSLGTNIYARTGALTRFTFNLVRADTTGSYNLDSTGNIAYYTDGVTTYRSISGTVNITQYYNDSLRMITGNFNFTGRVPGASGNTVSVTYGYFNNVPKH